MPYSAIYGISAEVVRVPNAEIEARGNILLEATYTGIGMYDNLEEALTLASSEVIDRFEGKVTHEIIVDAGGVFKEIRLGSTAYAPVGQIEIPLMFVSQVELDISQDIIKYFEVTVPLITATSED